MQRFTIIKKGFSKEELLIEMLQTIVGKKISIHEEENCTALFYEYDNLEDIQSMILSFSCEVLEDITAYTSTTLKIEKEYRIAIGLISYLPIGTYELKSALLSMESIKNRKEILDFILDSTGVDRDFVRGFIENDLNVSRASKAMFVHRNTMNYKLDRLKQISNFDLRCFQDSYILYSLIKK